MMVNSIKKNASFVFPRLGLLVVLLWLLWFVNSVIQNTWMVLLKQVRRLLAFMSRAFCSRQQCVWPTVLAAALRPYTCPCLPKNTSAMST
jgi:hypothetical protein